MEQAFIDNLSTDTLEMYSGATSFVGEVSYTKVNSDNVKTYVTEEEAITSAQLINSEQMIMQEGSLVQNRQQDTYQDSYMRVFYLVTYLGDDDNDPGKYYFSTDARWLTMPIFRGTDSIGSCAMECTVTNSSRSGWYEYDTYYTYGLSSWNTPTHSNMSSSSFQNPVNGNWYGSGAIINLPNDSATDTSSIIHTNYKAHYEYCGHVNTPTLSKWFNTIGTYDHSRFTIAFSPSLSIDTGGEFTANLGLDFAVAHDIRGVELEVHYIP